MQWLLQTITQQSFIVVSLKQYWIKVISTTCVCRVFIWTPIPASSWTLSTLCKTDSLAINLKIRKQLLKVAPWKRLLLNFVIMIINNLKFHPFPANNPILYPLETVEDLRSFYVYRGYKRETLGLNELKRLTCFFPLFPFYTPQKYQKTKGCFENLVGIKWEHCKKAWNKVFRNTIVTKNNIVWKYGP